MKVRTGFVSNSSSQSFCIYGVELDARKVINSLKIDMEPKQYGCVHIFDRNVASKCPICSSPAYKDISFNKTGYLNYIERGVLSQELNKRGYYYLISDTIVALGMNLQDATLNADLIANMEEMRSKIEKDFNTLATITGGEICTG